MKILGNTIIYGKDTLTATSNLQIYNGDSTPSLMWDWRNDGSVFLNQNTLFSFSGNLLTFTGGIVTINQDSGVGTRIDYGIIGGAVASWGSLSHSDHSTSTNYGFAQGSDGSTHINSIEKVVFYDTAVEYARFTGSLVSFFGTSAIGSETISLQGRTLVQGQDTLSTSTALEIYDGDTTPNLLWDWRNNGNIHQGIDANWYLDTNYIAISANSSSQNLFTVDATLGSVGVGGDNLLTSPSNVIEYALNFKYDNALNSATIIPVGAGGSFTGKLNISSTKTVIGNIHTVNNVKIGGNSVSSGATRSIEIPFGTDYNWKGINMIATQKSGGGADFEFQTSPSGLGGTYTTDLKLLKSGSIVQYAGTSSTADADLVNNSISFHISGKQLQGRYKDNGGTVYDLGVGIQYDSSCELSDIDAGSAIIGFCYVIKKKPSGDITVNNIDVLVTSGSSGTVYAGIYDSAGNLLDEGSATVSTTGILTIPLTTGGLQLEGGAEYWYGILEGSGSPNFGSKTVFNNSLIAQSLFVSLTPTGMPATLSGFGSVGTGFYIGVKV